MTPGLMLIEATELAEKGKLREAFLLVDTFVELVAANAYNRGYLDGLSGTDGAKTETSPHKSE